MLFVVTYAINAEAVVQAVPVQDVPSESTCIGILRGYYLSHILVILWTGEGYDL